MSRMPETLPEIFKNDENSKNGYFEQKITLVDE